MSNANKLHKTTWEEYGKIMEKLYKQINNYVKNNNITIDAVIPILRGGGFLGTFLAYKLRSLTILPVQYKYFFVGNNKAELRRILSTVKKSMFDKENPVFLTVEGDQCFGNTVIHTIKDLKKMFPKCKIIHVADCLDYYYRDSVKKDVLKIFYGQYTNHCEMLSAKECKKYNVIDVMAPWENIDEETAVMQGKQYRYINDEKVKNKSTKKAEFKF